jgi:hypothetical protein
LNFLETSDQNINIDRSAFKISPERAEEALRLSIYSRVDCLAESLPVCHIPELVVEYSGLESGLEALDMYCENGDEPCWKLY